MRCMSGRLSSNLVLGALYLLISPISQAEPARGIVSLDLCTDWMLLKYANPSQVRAYSSLLYRYPADWVPENLPTHNGSLEQILELDPELLITGEYNAILLRKRLVQLGKTVKVLPLPDGLDSIRDYQQQFLSIVKADLSVTDIGWDKVHPKKNRTLLLLGANGIGTGRDTLENDLLVKAGWSNYIQQSGYVNLQLEQIVADPPDAIYWSAPLSNSLANLFVSHPVIKNIMGDLKSPREENWRWQCPGPWSLELIEELAQWKKS